MSRVNDLVGITVLVTGASGFLGSRTVAILSENGCSVHALVRKTSRVDHLLLPNVTIYYGDVADSESLMSAFTGAEYIIHAAADTGGTEEGGRHVTIQGTRNILECCASFKVKKLVYISSCSVYGVADYNIGQLIDENAGLESAPERRGAYSRAKLEAEKLVTCFMEHEETSVVCLRPGTIYGPGGPVYMPMVGFSVGDRVFVAIDNGGSVLPLVYIDNLVAAIIASLTNDKSNGQIYNVVDSEAVNKKRYMDSVIRQLHPRSKIFYLSYTLLHFLVLVQEKMFAVLQHEPVLTCYRLSASQMPIVYDVTKIVTELNWEPVVTFDKGVANLIEYELKHRTA
jgi:nucleoside-diphosphate-sugar epimerase